jgi:hypothetical protein
LEEPKELAFLQSSTAVIFSPSAVMVMKPKGEGKDRLEIAGSLMHQLLRIFLPEKHFRLIVEKLIPKTRLGLGDTGFLA